MSRKVLEALLVPMLALPGHLSAREIDDATLAREVETYVQGLVAAGEFSGALMVARGEDVVFQGAWGLASRSFRAPNQVDTKFNLGSMNKMFTAVAISQLAQQGKVGYDDFVAKHLPDWPNAAVRDKVTIHQLLTHTSGMGSYFNDMYQKAAKEQFRRVRDYRILYAEEPLLFEPGSKWSYSNSGFMLLGEIVDAVSGKDYFDYVRENVTGPLGMKDTDCYEMTATPRTSPSGTRKRAPTLYPRERNGTTSISTWSRAGQRADVSRPFPICSSSRWVFAAERS